MTLTRQEARDAAIVTLLVVLLAAAIWLLLPVEVRALLGTLLVPAV